MIIIISIIEKLVLIDFVFFGHKFNTHMNELKLEPTKIYGIIFLDELIEKFAGRGFEIFSYLVQKKMLYYRLLSCMQIILYLLFQTFRDQIF
jgi:hypothetical protein